MLYTVKDRIKIFIIADSKEDFDETVKNYKIGPHEPELLTDVSQLEVGREVHPEVWDVRKISTEIASLDPGQEVMTMDIDPCIPW